MTRRSSNGEQPDFNPEGSGSIPDDASNIHVLQPSPAEWVFSFTEDKFVRFHVPTAPNAFYRFMQRRVLGIRWERLE